MTETSPVPTTPPMPGPAPEAHPSSIEVPVQGLSVDELDALLDDRAAVPATWPRFAVRVSASNVAALYVDGTLLYAGAPDDVYARAAEEAGIDLTEDESFLLGRESDHTTVHLAAAPTLDVAADYEHTTHRAAELRSQAEMLLAKAAELEHHLEETVGTLHPLQPETPETSGPATDVLDALAPDLDD